MSSPYIIFKVKLLLTRIEEQTNTHTPFYTFDTQFIPGLTPVRLKEPKQQDERKKIS